MTNINIEPITAALRLKVSGALRSYASSRPRSVGVAFDLRNQGEKGQGHRPAVHAIAQTAKKEGQ